MAFINNNKFLEIKEAANSGNEKALMILQALRKGNSQMDLDNLVNDYYNVVNDVPPIEEIPNSTQEEIMPNEDQVEQMQVEASTTQEVQPVDLTELLDGEIDGLLDENELEDLSFSDFLKNKRRDTLRSKKNNDYFKAFDMQGREDYLNNKKNAYNDKFNTNRRDIERQQNDLVKSLDNYSNKVNLMLDDDFELDMNSANSAYDDLTSDETAMKSFGRHWDEVDNQEMESTLQRLVLQYGKKNVMAVLNTLRGDADNYSKHKVNQIDTEINRYSKSLDNLLK